MRILNSSLHDVFRRVSAERERDVDVDVGIKVGVRVHAGSSAIGIWRSAVDGLQLRLRRQRQHLLPRSADDIATTMSKQPHHHFHLREPPHAFFRNLLHTSSFQRSLPLSLTLRCTKRTPSRRHESAYQVQKNVISKAERREWKFGSPEMSEKPSLRRI